MKRRDEKLTTRLTDTEEKIVRNCSTFHLHHHLLLPMRPKKGQRKLKS